MKINAIKVTGKELKPGDLFSTESQFYWGHRNPYGIGEKVYIRTEVPCPPDQREVEIYRIEINK